MKKESLAQTRQALGSDCTICLVGPDKTRLNRFMAKLWPMIDDFEARFSRFLATSELSHVNSLAGKRTKISLEFMTIITAAQRMSSLTDGIFNPLILPALQAAGYKNSLTPLPGPSPKAAPDYSQRQVTNPSGIELGKGWLRLPVDSALDFGGCGKGFLADKLADFIDAQTGIDGYWLSLGGDIVAKGDDDQDSPWKISVQNAQAPSTDIAWLSSLKTRTAVATSGIFKRRGRHNNKPWHHLIDTRTSQPAKSDLMAATIIHPSAFAADILASSVVILGSQEGVKLLADFGISEYWLQTDNTTSYVKAGKRIKQLNHTSKL